MNRIVIYFRTRTDLCSSNVIFVFGENGANIQLIRTELLGKFHVS